MADDISIRFGAQDEDLRNALNALATSASQLGERLSGSSPPAAEQVAVATHKAAEEATGLRERVDGLSESIRHAIEFLAVYEGLRFFKEAITGSLELGEKLKNMNIETGISTEHLQVLQYAAAATGAEFERLTMFVTQLRSRAAAGGGAAGGALAALGLTPADLNDSYGALLKIGDAINRLGP